MSDKPSWSITPYFPPTTQALVAESEAKLGVTFPDDYRQFLLMHNGGKPSPQGLVIPDLGYGLLLDVLYGIKENARFGDLVSHHREDDDDLPPGFILIGHDPGGSPLLLGTAGNKRGQVYWWDRTLFFKESTASNNTYWMADSFTEFMNSLYDDEETR